MPKKIFDTGIEKPILPLEAQTRSDVLFMAGAMRAARNSSPSVRAKIMADIEALTSTSSETLAFMFSFDNDNNDHAVFDFPDSERRRLIIQNNRLDAAE